LNLEVKEKECKLLQSKQMTKIHLGSGRKIIKNWINFDVENYPGVVVVDLRNGIPLADGSVSKIFSEHAIEHFDKKTGYFLLKECYRVLKSGGSIRIGWPDLGLILWSYLFHNPRHKKHILPHIENGLVFGHWDEILSDRLFSWEHRYAYTAKHLKGLMVKIGFKNVRKKPFMKSDYGFKQDTHSDPVTVYLEAIK